jgi:hypothetical protein
MHNYRQPTYIHITFNLEKERFRVFEKHGYQSIGVTFRQYVENYPQSVITMLNIGPGISDPIPVCKETLFILLFLVSGLCQENIGTPVATRPRTILGSLVPVLLGDIGI